MDNMAHEMYPHFSLNNYYICKDHVSKQGHILKFWVGMNWEERLLNMILNVLHIGIKICQFSKGYIMISDWLESSE